MPCNKLECNLDYDYEPYMTNPTYSTLEESAVGSEPSNFMKRLIGPIIGILAIYLILKKK